MGRSRRPNSEWSRRVWWIEEDGMSNERAGMYVNNGMFDPHRR